MSNEQQKSRRQSTRQNCDSVRSWSRSDTLLDPELQQRPPIPSLRQSRVGLSIERMRRYAKWQRTCVPGYLFPVTESAT